MKIVLWGAGGHGGVVLDALRKQGVYEAVSFIDDAEEGLPRHRSGLPICYGRHNLLKLRHEGVGGVVVTIGSEPARAEAAKFAREFGFKLCTIIHPSAVISSDVRVGSGAVVFAGAVVQTGCEIGTNAIINTCASIDHDCRIGDCAQVAPRAALGGRVIVGYQTFVGIGSVVINNVAIGSNCVIGAGAVVVHDIADNNLAYGVPARVIRAREPIG